MSNNILISFIVPVYNVPKDYLKKCLDSLIEQSEKNIEIIIVDDGSTDASGIIVDDYAEKDSRIKVIHKKNEGLSAARNTGVNQSKGIYISFVDGDDFIERDFSQSLLEKSLNNSMDIIIGKVIKDYGDYCQEFSYHLEPDTIFKEKDRKYFQHMILDFYGNISGVYGKLIKRELLLEKNIFHDEKLSKGAEGIVFNFRLFGEFCSAKFVNKNLYHYVYNENSISAQPSLETNKLVVSCFEKLKKDIAQDYDTNLMNKLYERMVFVIITTAISGIFHPNQHLNYEEKKRELDSFLSIAIVKECIEKKELSNIDFKRRMSFYFIVKKKYFFINNLAKLRFKQRKKKK